MPFASNISFKTMFKAEEQNLSNLFNPHTRVFGAKTCSFDSGNKSKVKWKTSFVVF